MKRASDNALTPPTAEVSHAEKEQIAGSAASATVTEEPTRSINVSQKQLVNKLNHLNFSDHTITIVFKHVKYPRTLTLSAHPLPCNDKRLVCNWTEPVDIEQLMESYQFVCFYLPKERLYCL